MSERRRSERAFESHRLSAFLARTKDKGRRRCSVLSTPQLLLLGPPGPRKRAQTSTDATREVKRLILLVALGSAFAGATERELGGVLCMTANQQSLLRLHSRLEGL